MGHLARLRGCDGRKRSGEGRNPIRPRSVDAQGQVHGPALGVAQEPVLTLRRVRFDVAGEVVVEPMENADPAVEIEAGLDAGLNEAPSDYDVATGEGVRKMPASVPPVHVRDGT